jgi:hypothetical protein
LEGSLLYFFRVYFARVFDAEARYFLLRTQKKVPKEKSALVCTGCAGSLRGSEKSAFA